ncbi:hypothetical protein [Micromonospora sp. B9E7]
MSRGILDTSVLIATDVTPIPGELAISVARDWLHASSRSAASHEPE